MQKGKTATALYFNMHYINRTCKLSSFLQERIDLTTQRPYAVQTPLTLEIISMLHWVKQILLLSLIYHNHRVLRLPMGELHQATAAYQQMDQSKGPRGNAPERVWAIQRELTRFRELQRSPS